MCLQYDTGLLLGRLAREFSARATATARLMTPEGVIAGQKARPTQGLPAACWRGSQMSSPSADDRQTVG
jgi:hypothetical protein